MPKSDIHFITSQLKGRKLYQTLNKAAWLLKQKYKSQTV